MNLLSCGLAHEVPNTHITHSFVRRRGGLKQSVVPFRADRGSPMVQVRTEVVNLLHRDKDLRVGV